jgi:hypothetical protein
MSFDAYSASVIRAKGLGFAKSRQDVSISGANLHRIELEIACSSLLVPERRWTVEYPEIPIQPVSDEMCVYGGEDITVPFNGPWDDLVSELGVDHGHETVNPPCAYNTDLEYEDDVEDCGDPACEFCREKWGPIESPKDSARDLD